MLNAAAIWEARWTGRHSTSRTRSSPGGIFPGRVASRVRTNISGDAGAVPVGPTTMVLGRIAALVTTRYWLGSGHSARGNGWLME